MTTTRATCRECGAPARQVHEGMRDRHFGVPGTWSVVECASCERLWLDPPPDADALGAAYDEYYTHDAGPPAGFEPWLKRAVPAARLGYRDRVGAMSRLGGALLSCFGPLRTIGERAVLWLEARPGARVLDVGCGSGELLERMRDLGWQVAGVELDPEGARAARERTGADVVASLDDVEPGGFDAVVLDHVLEHLADAGETLRGCLRALRPGGVLALATPNPGAAARERYGASWLHWDPPRHLELRGEGAMRAVVEGAGFEIDRIFTCAGSAHFVWSASRCIERDGELPGIRPSGLSIRERLSSLRFWVTEHARASRGEPCGEEWIVLARRPASATGGAS